MGRTYSFTTVTSTQDSFMKSKGVPRALLCHIKMINGRQKITRSGFLKKTPKWRSIWRRNLVEVELLQRNSFWKMTGKSSNSLPPTEMEDSSFTSSLLMILWKLEKLSLLIQERILSQWLLKGKNCQENLLWTNPAKLMHKISWPLINWKLASSLMSLEEIIFSKDVMILPDTTIIQSTEEIIKI